MKVESAPAGPVHPARPRLPERIARRLDERGHYPRWVLLGGAGRDVRHHVPGDGPHAGHPHHRRRLPRRRGQPVVADHPAGLASALALPVLGKMGDLYGHRRIFIGGFAVALVTTALTATASTPALLITLAHDHPGGRASTMPSSLALINSVHHGESRARAMGWWSMVSAGAPVIGLTVGAPVIDAVGWPTLFLMQAVLMVVPVLASWLVLRETPRRPARFDVAGAAALAVGLGPLLLAVDRVPEWGLRAAPTLVCLVVAAGGLAAFVAIERRVATPLVPLDFFRSRATTSTLVASGLSNAAYMGAFFLASLMMVEQFDYSLTSAVPILSIRPALLRRLVAPGRLDDGPGRQPDLAAGRVPDAGRRADRAGGGSGAVVAAGGDRGRLPAPGHRLRAAAPGDLHRAGQRRRRGRPRAWPPRPERLSGQLGVAFGITVVATVYAGEVDRLRPPSRSVPCSPSSAPCRRSVCSRPAPAAAAPAVSGRAGTS
jgi:MFS family permease